MQYRSPAWNSLVAFFADGEGAKGFTVGLPTLSRLAQMCTCFPPYTRWTPLQGPSALAVSFAKSTVLQGSVQAPSPPRSLPRSWVFAITQDAVQEPLPHALTLPPAASPTSQRDHVLPGLSLSLLP